MIYIFFIICNTHRQGVCKYCISTSWYFPTFSLKNKLQRTRK